MTSPDLTEANIDKLAELFPTVVTETLDADGNPQRAIDFDLLRQELSDHIVEGPQERYRLDWPGKRAAAFAANAPIAKTLRPVREESVDFDTTKNLFIEGDNLDALKLLQESYLGKVKLIYIDPPYNTGRDFIYNDDFAESSQEYLERSGQNNELGERLVANSDANGRFHSDWLSMIYPRLKLARNLLSSDGVVLISVNDREVDNLREITAEVFGRQNFVAQFVWLNEGNVDQQSKIKGVHEYVLAFARSSEFIRRPTVIDPNIEETSKLFREQIENSITKNGPANPPSVVELPSGFPAAFETGHIEARDDRFPHILNPIEVENGVVTRPAQVRSGWSSRNLLDLFISNGHTPIGDSEGRETRFELHDSGAIYMVKRRSADQGHVLSVLRNMGTTKQNSSMLSGWGLEFSYPKPVYLIQYLVSVFTNSGGSDIVLDFFAGSATTAHAVMSANVHDGGDRRYILVQLAEPATGGMTIAQLARKRIVAAATSLSQSPSKNAIVPCTDFGFRALRIDSTNMVDVTREPDQTDQLALVELEPSIKSDRSGEDVLFQVLLDWGLELSLPIVRGTVDDREVFSVDDDALIACFALSVTPEVVRAIAAREPLRAIFRDDAFESDAARINAEQVFREVSPSTEVRTI
ncbi:MAG: DNA methyltransferase [Ancrocorticia sp.]